MKNSLRMLHKIFKLEAERGFDNRAVVGGLAAYMTNWEMEARAENLDEKIIQAIIVRLNDYHRLSAKSRAEAIEGLWRRIKRETQVSMPLPVQVPAREDSAETVRVPPTEQTAPQKTVESQRETPTPPPSPENAGATVVEKPPTKTAVEAKSQDPPAALNAPVTVLPNVGDGYAKTLARLGLYELGDMLYNFPRRYIDYSQLKPINRLEYGEEVTVIGVVENVGTRTVRGGKTRIVEVLISDGTGALRITWFNQPWITKRLRAGMQLSLSGKIDQYLGRLVMNNPEMEPIDQQQLNTNRIVPVYSLTTRITQRTLRRLMFQVVSHWAPRVPDYLPESIKRSADLVDLTTALRQIHFPDSWEHLATARHRLAFDEIFLLQLGVQRQKYQWQNRSGRAFATSDDWLEKQLAELPFKLTGAQRRALNDVRHDLVSGHPMNRLLQGDVGSGKTIVAALAIGMVCVHGAQAALMAPTSILAEQHYKNLQKVLCGPEKLLQTSEMRLILGATPESEKQQIREELANGKIKLVVGTHALIEGPVTFADLQLAIVDEQHRFGVEQRASLRAKGENPHLLVMTATPIPRSLALTVYGDLDISVMDEMPPGRQKIDTFVLPPLERERAYTLIRSQVNAGRQAFIIYPLVEESDKSDSKAAVEEHARLQQDVFPNFKLGLLHGRLKPEEKDTVMTRFRAGDYHILVSTSVIEVGVDVPNATVMLIEGANRFGLAQLHQFRGRVGRGGDKSYCLLIPDKPDAVENERLQVMAQTNDGFVLAEHDLEQRGPGQFLGTRQSGYTELKLASLTDVRLIEKARRHAQELFSQDPNLERAEHRTLVATLQRFWGGEQGDIS